MKELFRRFLDYIEDFMYTSPLKSDILYINKNKNVVVYYNDKQPFLKIFISGLIYNLPLNAVPGAEDYSKMFKNPFVEDLESASLEDLEVMLKHYESDENYERCYEIQSIINSKLEKNDNN